MTKKTKVVKKKKQQEQKTPSPFLDDSDSEASASASPMRTTDAKKHNAKGSRGAAVATVPMDVDSGAAESPSSANKGKPGKAGKKRAREEEGVLVDAPKVKKRAKSTGASNGVPSQHTGDTNGHAEGSSKVHHAPHRKPKHKSLCVDTVKHVD